MPHNHPPRCCCPPGWIDRPDVPCPSCVEHGELATLGDCPSCHTHDGHPHTDYCQRENRDYPGQPGVRPDGRNAAQYPMQSTAHGDVDLVGALHDAIDTARGLTHTPTKEQNEARWARQGLAHQAGPWCPKPLCAWHGSPDR